MHSVVLVDQTNTALERDKGEHCKIVWGYYMLVVAVSSRARMAEQPGLHLVVGLEEEEEAKNTRSLK